MSLRNITIKLLLRNSFSLHSHWLFSFLNLVYFYQLLCSLFFLFHMALFYCVKIYETYIFILTILNVHFSSIKHVHTIMQPSQSSSPELFKVFSFLKKKKYRLYFLIHS